MLTRSGLGLLVIGGGLLIAGRVFGYTELFLLGIACGCLVLLALLVVWLRRPRLNLRRALNPSRARPGQPTRVDLELENGARIGSPVLDLHDSISTGAGARLSTPPLRSGARVVASYELAGRNRGVVEVGPLSVTTFDGFGLAKSRRVLRGRSEFIVYPDVDAIQPPPLPRGLDPVASAAPLNAVGRVSEDFYALREYVFGDDMRRVHWPSTARHDELMIRQDDLPRHDRTTVLIDTRADADAERFERRVSAAASIAVAASRRGDEVRLVTTAGATTQFEASRRTVDDILEVLARLTPTTGSPWTEAQDLLAAAHGGMLVTVTGSSDSSDPAALSDLSAGFDGHWVVRFGAAPGPTPPGTELVEVGDDFVGTWGRAVLTNDRRLRVATT